jgi:hypothetical protein
MLELLFLYSADGAWMKQYVAVWSDTDRENSTLSE